MAELKELQVKRSSIKGRLTKFRNNLDLITKLASLSSIQLSSLTINFSKLQNLSLEFDALQSQIEVLNRSALESELNERESIEQDFVLCIATAQEILSKHEKTTKNNESSNVSCTSHNCKSQDVDCQLSQIHISRFDGSYSRWLGFRVMFVSLIHNNKRIKPVHKYNYLLSYLVGDAAEVVSNLETSDANYETAWKMLCDRYDNKRQLINNHLNCLFNIEPITRESDKSLRFLVDYVGKHLRSLASLGQPTDKWNTLIIHMVSSKLDSRTSERWEEKRKQLSEIPTLSEFNSFLNDRADVLETVNNNKVDKQKRNSTQNFELTKNNHKQEKWNSFHVQSQPHDSATYTARPCIICKGQHLIYDCPILLSMSTDQRIAEVNKLKLCFNCLRTGHNNFRCRLGPCRVCKKRHNTLLHKSAPIQPPPSNAAVANFCSYPNNQVYLSTAVIKVINPESKENITVKALLDCGSETSFLTKSVQERLGVGSIPTNIKIVGIGNSNGNQVRERCIVQLASLQSNFNVTLSCSVLPELTGNVPKTFVGLHNFNLPSCIQLADPGFNESAPIDVLIGADLFWEIIGNEQQSLGANKPVLRSSQLGWIVSGPMLINSEPNKNIQCFFSKNDYTDSGDRLDEELARFWTLEELPQRSLLSDSEKACEKHFLSHTTRLDNGQFCVKLPLKDSPDCLGESYHIAKQRFLGLEKRFRKQPELKAAYINFIQEYQDLGHCSESSVQRPGPFNYFLCHHAVFRENSESTKIRVVYDGSNPSTSGFSVNDLQMIGPNIQDSIFSILLRMRIHKYILTGDVDKMYRAVSLHEDDRNLQLILWREDESLPIQTLKLNTVTYGFASASFLSTRCLWQLGEECSDILIKTIIQHDFLVDDLITGSDSEAQLTLILDSVTKALSTGCFHLRKFRTNLPSVFQKSGLNLQKNLSLSDSTNTLGLGWNPNTDKLNFTAKTPDYKNNDITKRSILSASLKIFDPLGLLSPCTVKAKILLQKLWIQKLGWDEKAPSHIQRDWEQIQTSNPHLLAIDVSRRALCDSPKYIELHSFCDSSMLAYGACIFLRSIDNNGQVTVKLLCAKSKVAPIKPVTIPRLELCGALLAARLCKAVTESLRITVQRSIHWCDSTVVLGWLNTSPTTLKAFVANRVAEICETTESVSWRHIPTKLNPADLISRGTDAKTLQDSDIWWTGPSFLIRDESEWPVNNCDKHELPEIKANPVHCTEPIINFDKYSKLTKLQRTFAYVLRFIQNLKKPSPRPRKRLSANELHTSLSVEELSNSYLMLIKLSQRESFAKECEQLLQKKQLNSKCNILSLNPFLDEQNIMRVGGRLGSSEYDYEKKHPILIDSKHNLAKLIFRYEHLRQMHAGPQLLLYTVRETLWPVGGRNLARQTVKACFRCRRLQGRTLTPMMGNLPAVRTQPAFPFQSVGVDMAGPFFILNRKGRGAKTSKCYLCIFICMRYKCVHLEAVSELSKDAYIATFKRFIARRGKPIECFSDNGGCFTAAAKEIINFFKDNSGSLSDFATNEQIKFHFSPVYGPNFGGLWEAGVKSAKYHIKRVMGNTNLTFEELSTLFAQVEAILNSRPLCPMSSHPDDYQSLSPGHFLIGRPLTSLPTPALEDANPNSLIKRHERLEQVRQHFWSRWQKEYISELQQRTKWKTNQKSLRIGDLVLLQDPQLSCLNWRTGRVARLFPGPDGIARVADVNTIRGCVRRPFSRLCPLPTQEDDA